VAKHKIVTIIILVIAIAATSTGFAVSGRPPAAENPADLPAVRSLEHDDGAPTTTEPSASERDDGLRTPSGQRPAAPDRSPSSVEPLREVLPGAGGPPPAAAVDQIGDLGDDRPVPAGLDLVAPPAEPKAKGLGGPSGLAVAPSCSHQCITKGVAYPRGFGAELVVETSVPAKLFITAIADLDGDGSYEETHVESTSFGLTSHSWALDHLEPATTYHVMAAATDEHNHTAHVWGQFTTLSQRSVHVELGPTTVTGGPGGIKRTTWWLGLSGPLADVTPGGLATQPYEDLPRRVDVELWLLRSWNGDLCEAFAIHPTTPPQGHSSDACLTWNSVRLSQVDLDVVPQGRSRWTQTSVQKTLRTSSDAGGALPAGYGDPYFFHFEMPVSLHVVYS
jgi:hypothetical protein